MRILICGSRDYKNVDEISRVINSLKKSDVVIHGCARGADSIAGRLAKEKGLEVMEFPARWDVYGKAAGPIRNEQMLVIGKPKKVYAFYSNKSKSKGTANMVKLARRAGVKVIENK